MPLSLMTTTRTRTPLDRPIQVAKFGDKPALVALYSRAAVRATEPLGKTSGSVHYETSLAQVLCCWVAHDASQLFCCLFRCHANGFVNAVFIATLTIPLVNARFRKLNLLTRAPLSWGGSLRTCIPVTTCDRQEVRGGP